MLQTTVLSLACLWASAPVEPSPYPQIQYREVVLGEVSQAAEQYEKLYLSPPSERRPLEIRLKAAFRAGRCFERLGQLDSARLAYGWMEREGAEAREPRLRVLVSEAGLRLRAIQAPRTVPQAEPEIVSVGLAVRQILDAHRDSVAKLDEVLVGLESELGVRRERLEERRELLQRLSSSGILLLWPEDQPISPGFVFEKLKGALPPFADLTRIQSLLAERYLERALLSLVSGNWLSAQADLRLLLVLAPAQSLASQWLDRILGKEYLQAQVGELARREWVNEEVARSTALRREVRSLLDSAEALLVNRGRVDLAVRNLDRIRDILDWTRPATREDLEVRQLSERSGRLQGFLSRSSGLGLATSLEGLARKSRSQVDRVMFLAEELVGVWLKQLCLEGPATLRGRADALTACRLEMERLLFRVEEAGLRGDRVTAQRLVREAATLLAWVPAVDPRSEYREAIEALRRGDLSVLDEAERPSRAQAGTGSPLESKTGESKTR